MTVSKSFFPSSILMSYPPPYPSSNKNKSNKINKQSPSKALPSHKGGSKKGKKNQKKNTTTKKQQPQQNPNSKKKGSSTSRGSKANHSKKQKTKATQQQQQQQPSLQPTKSLKKTNSVGSRKRPNPTAPWNTNKKKNTKTLQSKTKSRKKLRRL